MADKELGSLTGGTTPLDGTELHYVVQGGNSRKVTGANIVGIAHTHTWSSITSTPTTLSGYGITDAQPKDSDLTAIAALSPTDGSFLVGNGTAWTAESGSTARASLGLTIGTDVQPYDADLSTIASLSKTDGAVIIGDGTNWTIESGATFRASVGLTIGTNVQAYSATLGSLSGLSLSSGDILYSTGANALARLAKGTDGQVLRLSSGIPSWTTATGTGDMLGANNLSDLDSASSARTNLGLGSAATSDTGDFATAAQGATADTAVQPGDLATVATTGAYSDLSGTPTLGTASAVDTIDEDDMASNSATKVPTQQSVKAYVDTLTYVTGTKVLTPLDPSLSNRVDPLDDTLGADFSASLQEVWSTVAADYASANSIYRTSIAGAGRTYRIDTGIDGSGIRNPGIVCSDMGFYGTCTDENMLDVSYGNVITLRNCRFIGDATNTPKIGVLNARGGAVGSTFPSSAWLKIEDCLFNGYFSQFAHLNFAGEVSQISRTNMFNKHRSRDAYVYGLVSHAGTLDDYVGGVTSAFQTIPTAANGTQSNVLHHLDQCLFQRTSALALTVTAITKASTAVVTVSSTTGLANDDQVYFYQVAGMTEVNDRIFTVKNLNTGAKTFELYDEAGSSPINSTGYTTFVSGILWNATGPAALFNGPSIVHGSTGYFLTYGEPSVVWDVSRGGAPKAIDLGFQGEHNPSSLIRFDGGSSNVVINGLSLNLPSANQSFPGSVLASDSAGSGIIRIDNLKLRMAGMTSAPTNKIFDTPSRFSLKNVDIALPLAAAMNDPYTSGFAVVPTGKIFTADDNRTRILGGPREEIAQSAVAGSNIAAATVGTTETILQTINMPAGYPGNNGKVRVRIRASCTAHATTTKTARVRLNGVSGAVTASITTSASAVSMAMTVDIENRNSATSQISGPVAFIGAGSTTQAFVTSAVNTNAAWTIDITGAFSAATSGETMKLESYEVEVIRP